MVSGVGSGGSEKKFLNTFSHINITKPENYTIYNAHTHTHINVVYIIVDTIQLPLILLMSTRKHMLQKTWILTKKLNCTVF